MHRIHVVGISARTGTTLMVEAMRACFAIDGFHAREERLPARMSGVSVHLSKAPGDLHRIGARLVLDPRLYVLCMVRDPRDVIVSEIWSRPACYFVDLARPRRGFERVRRYTGHERFIVIRYEDLVRDPSGVQGVLEQRMPFLEKTADFRDFHRVASGVSERNAKDMHGLRRIDSSSVGRWREHLPRVAEQRGGLTDLLVGLGYERDDSWERILEGVAPLEGRPQPADIGRRMLWLPPALRRPLRRVYLLVRSPGRVEDFVEGLRGLIEYLTRSDRG